MNEPKRQRYALVVGIDNYANCRPRDQLSGCVNDARAWHSLLTGRFAFPPEHVKLLLDAGREEILDTFKSHLIGRAGPGDLVVFAFAGHGSYTWDEEGDEPDGYDETLVPADSHPDPTKEPRHIKDDELYELNQQLMDQIGPTGFVSYLIDSCHSGSITRGVGQARYLEPELPPPPRDDLVRKTRSGPGQRRLSSEACRPWFPDQRNYVLLAACRDDEVARETRDLDGNSHGIFTLFLSQALQRASRRLTYLDLLETASLSIRSVNPNQTPQLEGDGHQVVFGLERFDQEPYLPVQETDIDGVVLGGGAAHLVTSGSLFAIHPTETHSQRQARAAGESPRAQVRVTQVAAVSARAVYDPAPPTGRVEIGCRAFELRHNYTGMQWPVSVVGVSPHNEAAREELGKSSLLQVVGLDGGPRLVVWAVQPDATLQVQNDLTVPRGLSDGPAFVITDIGGESLMEPIPAGTDEHVQVLRENVEQIAKHRNLLALRNDDPEAILRGRVQLALKRLHQQGDRYVAVDPEFDGQPIFTEGDLIALEITNHHDQAIYFSVFDLGLSWKIGQLYPPRLGSDKLAAGGTFVVGLRHGKPMHKPATIPKVFPSERAFGRETFKVLLTMLPTDFNWLCQPGVTIPRVRSSDPLRVLLAMTRSGQAPDGFRGDDFATPASRTWFAEQVTFVLRR